MNWNTQWKDTSSYLLPLLTYSNGIVQKIRGGNILSHFREIQACESEWDQPASRAQFTWLTAMPAKVRHINMHSTNLEYFLVCYNSINTGIDMLQDAHKQILKT